MAASRALLRPGVSILASASDPKVGKIRMHLDVRVDIRDRFERLLALGARVVERRAEWTVLADPEGNEFCAFGPGAA